MDLSWYFCNHIVLLHVELSPWQAKSANGDLRIDCLPHRIQSGFG